MKNLLLSVAIGDISGMPYEFHPTKDYNKVDLMHPANDYTDDTVCTFACAEALLHHADMAQTLHARCRADWDRGYGGRFRTWLMQNTVPPAYNSYGNGSGMRCSAAGFMAQSAKECIVLATLTALPTHNHAEGIKGAVATALAIHYAMKGHEKDYIRQQVLRHYYPEWADKSYAEVKARYHFDETCQQTIPAALICFLESHDYADCVKLAIALGGDADTLAAIAAPMAYAFYKSMPDELVRNAKSKLPQWMLKLNDEMDAHVASGAASSAQQYPQGEKAYGTPVHAAAGQREYRGTARPAFTPEKISVLKDDEVFVFGSNLAGIHGGGAAWAARMHFGAVMGQGVGLQGQSYAIPTMQGGVETIRPYVNEFIDFALSHRELFFYVTRIGCGIAGFRDADIAPLFGKALTIDNICLPRSFVEVLSK